MTTFTSSVRNLILMIDWDEAQSTAIHALKVAIVLTLLAGRATRWVWDSLPEWSEALGHWYSSLIVDDVVDSSTATVLPMDADNSPSLKTVAIAPILPIATPTSPQVVAEKSLLFNLSNAQLREIAGIRSRLSKRQLVIKAENALLIGM